MIAQRLAAERAQIRCLVAARCLFLDLTAAQAERMTYGALRIHNASGGCSVAHAVQESEVCARSFFRGGRFAGE